MGAMGGAGPRSILFNFSWSACFVLFTRGIRFLAVALCVRHLGSYGWGQIASTFVTVSFLYFLVDQGLNLVPPLHRVKDPAADRDFLRKITLYRTAMALIVIAGVHAWDVLVHPVERLILIFSWVLLPRAWNLDWWFQRHEVYYLASGLSAAKALILIAGVALLVRPGADPALVVWCELAAEIAGAGLGLLLLRRARAGNPARADGGPAIGYPELIRLGQPFLWIGILHTVHQSVDVLFLKYLSGYQAVGEYDVGYKIGYFLFFMGATVVQIIRPRIAALAEGGRPEEIARILAAVSRILAALAAAFMVFSFYGSGPVLLLVFGQDTPLTRFVFQWASVWVATAFMTMLCADTLLGLGHKGSYLLGCVLCASINVAGNWLLIRGYGPVGSIFATLLAEAAFLAYAWLRLPVAIRAGLAGALGRQAGICAALAAIFLGATRWGLPPLAPAALSAAGLGLYLLSQKPFARSTLAVLRA